MNGLAAAIGRGELMVAEHLLVDKRNSLQYVLSQL
jgi:hypothetical protein